MNDHILIVDDDRQLTTFLERFLRKHGYRASTAASGKHMRAMIGKEPVSLVVLDLNLPDADGFELARELHSTTQIPIIMLTSRDEIYDRVVGLEMGADDYMTKPYEPRELLARIRSVMRRSEGARLVQAVQAHPPARRLRFGGLVLDIVERRLYRSEDAAVIPLTGTEFALLRTLAEGAGSVRTRDLILETVYGNAVNITHRAIDSHIARLRRKIDETDSDHSMIQTVHGEGYLLATGVEAE